MIVDTIRIGDTVEFNNKSAGISVGKILSILGDNDRIEFAIYCTDSTGGYSVNVLFKDIIKVIREEKSMAEEIKKPSRYNKRGKLECWDVIIDQKMDFLEGSVLKYLWRYKEKNGIHDLEKAKVYIDKIIEGLKNETD
jgi:hypothetical protein